MPSKISTFHILQSTLFPSAAPSSSECLFQAAINPPLRVHDQFLQHHERNLLQRSSRALCSTGLVTPVDCPHLPSFPLPHLRTIAETMLARRTASCLARGSSRLPSKMNAKSVGTTARSFSVAATCRTYLFLDSHSHKKLGREEKE